MNDTEVAAPASGRTGRTHPLRRIGVTGLVATLAVAQPLAQGRTVDALLTRPATDGVVDPEGLFLLGMAITFGDIVQPGGALGPRMVVIGCGLVEALLGPVLLRQRWEKADRQ